MNTRCVVVSVGARTPIGLRATPTAFLYRAAHIVMQSSPIVDKDDQPATLAAIATIDPCLVGAERASVIGLPALTEALAPLNDSGAARAIRSGGLRIKLVVCFDEFVGARDANGIVPAVELTAALTREVAKLGCDMDVDTSSRGGASLGFALDRVLSELESGRIEAAIVGGVHTDYDPARIVSLSMAGRLFTPDTLDAIIPGECAAFSVLMLGHTARRYGLRPLVEIHQHATGQAKARPDNDASAFEASALTAATRRAAEPLVADGLRCGWLLTDLSFETMRLYEFQAMSTRTQKLWCEPQYCDAPAQRLGYLGAAAMPLHIALAAEAWRGGFAPHRVAMSFAGSDGGERAVMLMSAPGPE